MITLNRNKYKLCLLDTNGLSLLLKDPKKWFNFLHNEFNLGKTILCYSVYTIGELKVKEELFEKFLELFSSFPSVVLDGLDSLFKKEVSSYDSNSIINPILFAPHGIEVNDPNRLSLIRTLFQNKDINEKFEYWKNGRTDVIEGILELIKNFPPKGEKYTVKEINRFVELAGFSQLAIRDATFCKSILDKKRVVNIKKFPSINMITLFVFYKYYKDRRINPKESDVFDLIISSLIPYVDIFISEGNSIEILRQIKRNHNYPKDLDYYSIKEIAKK